MAEEINNGQQQNSQQAGNAGTPTQPKAEDIANALLSALEARTARAEKGVVKSFSEQYGLSDAEINAILAKAKAEKDAKIPEAAQAAINAKEEKIKQMLISAEIKTKGTALGLLDADTALLLVDKSKVTVDENGAVKGIDEALTALKESKPFLFGAQIAGKANVGGAVGNNGSQNTDGVEAAFLRRNPGLKV